MKYDKLYKNYAHEVIGPLCHGIGVCEGIAKTAKLLFDAVGIESIVVIGKERKEKDGLSGVRHAWNIVRIGGRTYHFDATFDNSLTRSGVRRYDYYNLSDEAIAADHRESVYAVPPCVDGDASYYRREGLCADSPEALAGLLRRIGTKRTNGWVFQWSGSVLLRDEIFRVCSDFAVKRGKRARICCNPPQKTFFLTLSDFEKEDMEAGIYEQSLD